MNISQFKEIEARFSELKVQLESGKVSPDAYKQELKKLMLQDEQGRYWMIGGKSGGWYVYDNNEWKSANPFPDEPQKAQEPPASQPAQPAMARSEGHSRRREPVEKEEAKPAHEERRSGERARMEEEDRDDISSERSPEKEGIPCRYCQSAIPLHAQFCPFCGGNQKKVIEDKKSRPAADGILELKSIRITSLILFLGGIGIIIGVILGASFGIFDLGGDLIYQFPQMLQETRGKIQGGLIFGAMGGIAGAIAGSLLALVLSLFYNAVSFLFGGIRFRTKT